MAGAYARNIKANIKGGVCGSGVSKDAKIPLTVPRAVRMKISACQLYIDCPNRMFDNMKRLVVSAALAMICGMDAIQLTHGFVRIVFVEDVLDKRDSEKN